MEQEVGSQILPFVRMFYGDHSTYLWEDDVGTVHRIEQGEGGEQCDVWMPLLFSLGQHAALQAVQDQLLEGERLFAFLDDIYVVTTPERVGHVDASCGIAATLFHPDQRWQNSSVERSRRTPPSM